MSTIGERMRELRGTSSQKEMAEAVGIKYNAWARYEAGGAIPGGEIIIKICRAHACSADWLLGLRDDIRAVASSSRPDRRASPPAASSPPDCSRCQLMLAHIREITGRK